MAVGNVLGTVFRTWPSGRKREIYSWRDPKLFGDVTQFASVPCFLLDLFCGGDTLDGKQETARSQVGESTVSWMQSSCWKNCHCTLAQRLDKGTGGSHFLFASDILQDYLFLKMESCMNFYGVLGH